MPMRFSPIRQCRFCVWFALISSSAIKIAKSSSEGLGTAMNNSNSNMSDNNTFLTTVQFNQTFFPVPSGPDKAPITVTTVLLATVISLMIATTIIGNAMVIFAVLVFRRLRTIPNMFVVSLASADFIMGVMITPLGAHNVLWGKWQLSSFACEIWTSIDVLSVTASICTLCAISLDRFVAINMPFRYSQKMTRLRARFIIGAIWIISALIAFVPIHLEWWKTSNPEDVACYDNPRCCEFRTNTIYALVSSCVSFYIPLIIMVVAYSVVFRIALKQRSVIRNNKGIYRRASMPGTKRLLWGNVEYRAVFTMGIIMGTFVICWLPFFIVNVGTVLTKDFISQTAFMVLNWLGYANSCFNPIIYCHSKEFRRAFKRILQCGLCRDGYQRTSRASLAISYTPSASTRSSVREGSLYHLTSFFLTGRNSRRVSRMSTSSAKSARRSPVNGHSPYINNNYPRTGAYGHRGGETGRYAGGNRNEYESVSDTSSSSGIIVNSYQQTHLPSEMGTKLQVRNNSIENAHRNELNLNSNQNGRVTHLRDQRSLSLHLNLTPDVCKRLLFKSKSHHNVSQDEDNSDSLRLLSHSSSESNQSETKTENKC